MLAQQSSESPSSQMTVRDPSWLTVFSRLHCGRRDGTPPSQAITRLISYPPILRAFTIASACRIAKRVSKPRFAGFSVPHEGADDYVRIAASSA